MLNVGTGGVKRHAGGYVWEIQIGGSASERIGFYGVSPVVQPSGADQAAVTLGNVDGEIAGLTISDPPTQPEVQALRDKCEELADDVRALSTLVHALGGVGSGGVREGKCLIDFLVHGAGDFRNLLNLIRFSEVRQPPSARPLA